MSKELQQQYEALINTIKNKKIHESLQEQRNVFITALKDVAVLALDLKDENDTYYEFLYGLRTCLQELFVAKEENLESKLNELKEFLSRAEYQIDDKKRSSNQWKAAGILILVALEFLILSVIFVPVGAVIGTLAVASLMFIALVLSSSQSHGFSILFAEKLMILSAVSGAIIGAIAGVMTAGIVSYFSIDWLKETTWMGLDSHDSLWDLLIHGDNQKSGIVKTLKNNCAFFLADSTTPYPDEVSEESVPLVNFASLNA
jgi:hypothetical protein